MIGTSLTDNGVELLGRRRGLQAYLSAGKTMGIPILYPWANRLGESNYRVGGDAVTLAPDAPGLRTDANGLPMHGLLAAFSGWRVTNSGEDTLSADVDFGAHPELLASFPFPHRLTLTVTLSERELRVSTTVTPTADKAVPLCFGFHPYLQLPDVPRSEWHIETPPMRHLNLDERGIPTGVGTEWPPTSEALGDNTFDDAFDEVPRGAWFALSGGTRRIEVCFDRGYSAAQIFAPAADDVICFEPMAAPTNALRRGGYEMAEPGTDATAVFTITVAS
ncbi:MAG: aldose 1-epimerase [Mycobacterium sp.]|jgi:aldose 1-epimerase|nr:aldose 1-epimerase [Mycobacterium sp.]